MHVRRLTLPPIASLRHIEADESKSRFIKKVNQYLLLKKIGQGANCKVVLGYDVPKEHYYAVKVFHTDARRMQANVMPLEREVRIMRMINHENIVKLHEVLHAPQKGASYLIMELGDCGSLKKIVDSEFIKLSEKSVATIFKHVARGIAYLHSQGIVHQDIKPSNILIFSNGIAKIGDFGIGHSFQSADTVVGSPAYQAPEVFEDEPDENGEIKDLDPTKEDVWSLGVTLFECVFKCLPFVGGNVYEIVRNIKQRGLVLPNEVSPELHNLLFGMINVDPDARYSMQQVIEHPFLDQADETLQISLKPMDLPVPDPKLPIMQIQATVSDGTTQYTQLMRQSSSWSGCAHSTSFPK